MKTLVKAIAIATLASTAAVAQAEVSATLGAKSSYMFRGLEMADSMTTHAGIGFDLAGLSVGITLTDSDGNDSSNNQMDANTETDIALGYTMNVMGTDLRLAYTDYSYNYGTGNAGNNGDNSGQTEFSVGITASDLSIDYLTVKIQLPRTLVVVLKLILMYLFLVTVLVTLISLSAR
jgi:hypothetical protein